MNTDRAELDRLAVGLRDRVAEGRYLEAQRMLDEYCQALRETAARLPPGDPGLRRLDDERCELLESVRRRILAGRAHAGARLKQSIQQPPPYGDLPQLRRTWQCMA